MSNRDGNRRVEGQRLVYYHQAADKDFWESQWKAYTTNAYYQPFQAGRLFTFDKIFKRHLPKQGRILEAGCGTAQFVVALRANGYDCFGLDYAFGALQRARKIVGALPLACGDLTALGIANDTFDAVISLGVVEHRREGPEPFLREMHRILKANGMLLISVPYFNPLRQWRAGRGAYQDDVSGLDFYQYAFSRREFFHLLEEAGYEITTWYSYAHQNTLSQELHGLKRMPSIVRTMIMRLSKYLPYVSAHLGHMLMVVARKKSQPSSR
ncbi:MAG TPA: class I SAM-dependent methyltransferase [Anaerolineales bacterium]|nr:class I SAM-dependent methyltransferase [Anaerolineales bacterium]